MTYYTGHISEILLEAYQNASARLVCPPEAVPTPGQYLQAFNPQDDLQAVPVSLFPAGAPQAEPDGRVSLPVLGDLRPGWAPGTQLALRGPLGRGFALPKRAKRVALVSLAGGPGRLLPLAQTALAQGAAAAVCSQPPAVGDLPPALEVHGLDDLPEVLAWADYAALELRAEGVENLESLLGIRPQRALAAQALVLAPMPCGGLAACGVCTLQAGRGSRLACADGPVFDLRDLLRAGA